MDKKKGLTEEERAAFAEAVKNVKPLAVSEGKNFRNQKIIKTPWRKKVSLPPPSMIYDFSPIDLEALAADEWVDTEERIKFNRGGLQDKVLKKLAHGQIPIEARLDLHRMILAAAIPRADAFLQSCQQQNYRLVLIIHGKGKKSAKPVLKNALNIWLRTQGIVLAFHSAQPKDGGAGAIYVVIKSI